MDIYSHKNPKICRTCLHEISNSSQIFYLDTVETKSKITTTRQKLVTCVPELNLAITPNAVICSDCLIAVDSAYNFKNKCLRTDERIHTYLQQSCSTSSCVDLLQVVQKGLICKIKTENFEVVDHEIDEPEPFFRGFKKDEIYSGKEKSCNFAELALQNMKKENLDELACNSHLSSGNGLAQNDPEYLSQGSSEYNSMWTETEGFYICKVCDHITERKSKLVAHLRTHEIEKPDDKCISQKIDLTNVESPYNTKDNKNEDASSKNNTEQELPQQIDQKKIMTSDGETIYMCNECEYITERKSKLDAHSRGHKSDYNSQVHSVTRVNKSELSDDVDNGFKPNQANHNIPGIKSEEMEALYMCNDCEYITERKSKLDAHTRTHKIDYSTQLHNVIKISNEFLSDPEGNPNDTFKPNQDRVTGNESDAFYMCNECEYITERKSKLIVHLRTHKENEPDNKVTPSEELEIKPDIRNRSKIPYQCSLCPYGTRNKVRLDEHIKLHTGEKCYKSYCCYVCNYTTPLKKCLIVHLKIHGEDKPFKCTDCEYKAHRIASMHAHSKRHLGKKRNNMYTCYVCSYKTPIKKQLDDHLKIHGEAKSFKCTKCEYRCNRLDNMKIHLRRHLGIKPFKCPICPYRSIRKTQLKVHIRKHSDDKPFKCAHCDYCSSQKHHLEKHLKAHPTQSPYKCYVCDYESVFKRRLVAHLKTHGESKVLKCIKCDYKCDSSYTMNVHTNTHSKVKPYKCSFCDYSTVSKSYFGVHMRIHTGEKPYKCNVCNFQTATKFSLVLHVRVHTGEKPHKCTMCAYKARSRTLLREHLKTHVGKKIYRCVMCSYRCINRKLLQGHMYVHSEAKIFKCNMCNLSYKHRGSLRMHMRKHTGVKYTCITCNYSTISSSHLRRHIKLKGHDKTPCETFVE